MFDREIDSEVRICFVDMLLSEAIVLAWAEQK